MTHTSEIIVFLLTIRLLVGMWLLKIGLLFPAPLRYINSVVLANFQ